MDIQTQMMNIQNDKINIQNSLIEAERRSSLVFLMSSVLDKIDDELKNPGNNNRSLSPELIGRIISLSHSLKPYQYIINDTLIHRPLSPERGQLLLSLSQTKLDTNNLKHILKRGNFRYSDLKYANLDSTYLVGIDLSNSNLEKTFFKDANLKGSRLNSCNLFSTQFVNANLVDSQLIKSDIQFANFTKANMTGAKLNNSLLKSANFVYSNLSQVSFASSDLRMINSFKHAHNFLKSDLKNANLRGIAVSSIDFLDKIHKIQNKYILKTKIDPKLIIDVKKKYYIYTDTITYPFKVYTVELKGSKYLSKDDNELRTTRKKDWRKARK